MKHGEEAVEKVLAGLGRVEAPHGLERRVLKGAQDRVAMRSRPPWRRRGMTPALLGGLALAVAGVAGVWHGVESGSALPPVEVARATPTAGSPRVTPSVIRMPLKAAGRPARKKGRRERIAREEDSMAFEEMHAASKVAPPLPLTEQERMLLRIVHQGDPEELAMLSPEMRLRQDAEGNAEFQRFFGVSRVKANQKP